MSKSVRAALLIVLVATSIVGVAAPFVRFMFLTPGDTNVAVVMTPMEVALLYLAAIGLVSLALWAFLRRRAKQP